MLKMLSTLRYSILLFVSLIFFTFQASSQTCQLQTDWTFNPPLPPGGAYDAGTTIEICGEVTGYSAGGANWLSGIVIEFPPGWDLNSISNITLPTSCGSTGEWIYLETLDCNGFDIDFPGFYYDSNVSGVQDGNPCNNWGDGSVPCPGWSFCFEIDLDPDCGGGGNPLNGNIVTPIIQGYSDSEIGSWGSSTGCPSNDFESSPSIDFEIDCCDADAGTPPVDPVNICGTTPFNLNTLLNPIGDPGGTWSGPPGWTLTAGQPIFDPNSDVPGDYIYEVTGTDNCINQAIITMEYIDLGLQAIAGYCEPTATIPLLTLFTNNNPNLTPQPGGTWTDPNGNIDADGILDPLVNVSGIYTYEYVDLAGCITFVQMQVTIATGGGNPVQTSFIDVCTIEGPFIPFDSIVGNPVPGGQWLYYDDSSPPNVLNFYFDDLVELDPLNYDGGADNGTSDDMVSGFLIYNILTPPCPLSQDTMFVNVGTPFDAGDFTEVTVCENDPAFVLESVLLGTPTLGGNWEYSDGTPAPNLFDPSAVIPDSVYTLIYSGGLASTLCFESQVMLLTVLSNNADAGIDNSITVCETEAPFPMVDELGGTPQPGGTWTDPIGNVIPSGFFIPGTNPPGIYTYTLNSPCGSDVSQLTISVTNLADPGIDGSLFICANQTNVPLIDGLGGTPDTPGIWTLNGFPAGPTVNGNAVNDGDVYVYTVGTGTCQATSQVTIDLNQPPFAGTATTTPQAYCETAAPFSLFDLLTTPPSITDPSYWTGPGGFTGANFDPSSPLTVTGNYTYTIPDNGCGSDSETIFITIETTPNAGTNTVTNVCPNGTTPIDLLAELGGDPGGTWTAPPGGPTNGILNPGDPEGTYTYTLTSSPNNLCTATASTTVFNNFIADAGTDNTITVCETDPTINLIDSVGGTPDPGGIWAPSATFIPGVSIPGPYTYLINNPGCPPSTSILTVNVQSPPDAGVSTSVQLCESLGFIDLTSYLNGTPQPGGTWTDLNTGNPVSNPFDISSLCGSNLSLQYEVSSGVCTSTSTLGLVVQCIPEAGDDVTETYCADNSALDLNLILAPNADSPGEFTNSLGGIVTNGIIVLNPGAAGTYTYTVDGDQCPDDQASYTINLDDPITVTDQQTNCTPAQDTYIVSLTFSGGDGNYNVTGLPGMMISPTQFESDPIPVGNTYSFTVDDGGPCPGVSVGPTPGPNCACPADAEFVDNTVNICEGQTADLELNFPSGVGPFAVEYGDGTNTFPNQGPFVSGDVIQVTPASTTTYTLTLVSDQNCTTSITDAITVVVENLPDAGPDVTDEFCGTGGSLNLNTLLDVAADVGGTFFDPLGNPIAPPGNITQIAASSGIYTYEVTGTQCPADQALYDLTIFESLSVNVVSAVCTPSQTDYVVTFEISGGDGNYNITGMAGTLNTTVTPAIFTSNPIATGTPYSYSVSEGSPCPDVSAGPIPSPNCACPATASFVESSVTICAGDCADLELSLSGTGPFTVSYTDGTNPIPNAGPFVDGDAINVCPSVTTTYTLTGVADQNCNTTASDAITVIVETPPNAGPDVSEEFCATNAPYNLINLVDGSVASTNGAFLNPGGSPVPANTVTLNAAASGIYTYEVDGSICPTDQAFYDLTINDPITITNVSVDCNQAQTGYIVSFNISGGDGNYSVSEAGGLTGTIIPGSPAFFESQLIPNDTDYDFTISDGSACADEFVIGTDPDCDCPAAATLLGTTSICDGECAQLTFDLEGDGPFDVVYENSSDPINPITLTDISDGHMVTVCPDATSTYTILSVNDVNCSGLVNGQPVTVTVDPPMVIGAITETCDANNETYTVSFSISGGIPGTYQVTPFGGSIAGGVYTSSPIVTGEEYEFTVTDAGACEPVLVNGSFACPCETEAGSIAAGLIEVCEGDGIQVPFNDDEVLDGNDGYQFLLHDGDDANIGAVLATSFTPEFTFPDGIEFGVTYYVTGVAGNTDFFGNVILSAPCTDQTEGVPVVFNELPSATISGTGLVCPGEVVDIQVTLTGTGPWDFSYSVGGDEEPPIFTSDNEYTISTTQPGSYTLVEVSDSNCLGTVSGVVQVSNYAIPTATIGGDGDVCENSNDGPVVEFTGQPPYTFTYSLDGEEFLSPITTNAPSLTIPAETGGTYELVTMSDANCEGIVQGSLEVTILEAPSAIISGGGTVCEGDEALFEVELTGNGPWNIIYEIGGVPQDPINTSDNSYTFTSGVDGDYVIAEVTDQNCSGEVVSGQAELIVNPLPTAEIITDEDALCIGQELELIYELQGTPPFEMTYILDGDTITTSGITSDLFLILQPTEPVFTQVLFVQDSSDPVCQNNPDNSKFIPVGELPNAPELEDIIVCADEDSVSIGVEPVEGLTYSWSPTTFLTDPDKPTTRFDPDEFEPVIRQYSYVLTATNGECSADDTITVTVDPGPRARFSYNPFPVNTVDTKVRFSNNSIAEDYTLYFWTFDTLGTSQEENPIFEFPEGVIANYSVSLLAIDPLTGCSDERVEVIEVKPEMLVFVPNAFTPDGDGINDLWGPVLTNVDEDDYVLTIFNRNGEIVFQTRDVNQKWNGSMNGDDYYVKTDVYVWQIETKNLISLEEIDFKGTVTVIR